MFFVSVNCNFIILNFHQKIQMLFTFKVALCAKAYELIKINGAQTELSSVSYVQRLIKQFILLIKRPDLCISRSAKSKLRDLVT